MRRSHAIWGACFALGAGLAAPRRAPQSAGFPLGPSTRLLVFAPHPDDEIMGAGGLIQRVRAAGGAVQVVYLTDGEAYREGVRALLRRPRPTAADYRRYGEARRREARAALGVLGVDSTALRFLGFPQGLDRLLTGAHWSRARPPYRSPYTQLVRPPEADTVEPDARFRGEDLRDEVARVIEDFRPTQVLVTRKEDQHVDHCAAWYLVSDAVAGLRGGDAEPRPAVFTYIVHYYAWPFQDDTRGLDPPPGLSAGPDGWVRVPLARAEVRTKRTALHRYRSQMKMMSWFLDAFARSSELFGRPTVRGPLLPLARDPCAAYVDREAHP